MAFVLDDRVKETTTTSGTGTLSLLGAATGFQSFSAGIGDGNTTFYTIAHQLTTEWEVGVGTYTAAGSLLSRDTILSSSNSDAAVNFAAGTKDVFVDLPSSRYGHFLVPAGALVRRIETETSAGDSVREDTYQARAVTTDATPTDIILTPGLADNHGYSMQAHVLAVNSSTFASGSYFIGGTFKRPGGALAQIGPPGWIQDFGQDFDGLAHLVAKASNTIAARVTGVAGQTIVWHITARLMRISA